MAVWALVYQQRGVLKIAGQEHPDRHRPTAGIKQWMAPAVDTQLNQLFHTQFHQVMSPEGRYELRSPLIFERHLPNSASPRNWTSSPSVPESSMQRLDATVLTAYEREICTQS